MKKIILIMALLLIVAASAMAAVTVTSTKTGRYEVTVGYVATAADVRAFAFDVNAVRVGGGATITSITNLSTQAGFVGNYFIHPGSTTIKTGTPSPLINAAGTINCIASKYAGTLPGLSTNGVTTEQATLYSNAGGNNNASSPGGTATGSSGNLFKLVVSGGPCTVQVRENAIRGGVVMEAPGQAPGLVFESGNILTSTVIPCLFDATGALEGVSYDTDWNQIYDGIFDTPNGVINLSDFAAMANVLVYTGGTLYSVATTPATVMFDVTATLEGVSYDTDWNQIYDGIFDAPNGIINLSDFAALANVLVYTGGSGYSKTCP